MMRKAIHFRLMEKPEEASLTCTDSEPEGSLPHERDVVSGLILQQREC